MIGTCVASQKSPGLEGRRLMIVEPVDPSGRSTGAAFVAVDTVGAGPGEVVLLVGAREAALALEVSFVPVDAAIVGLVDDVHREGEPGFLRGRDDLPRGRP